ncbi:MAG TPA: DUF4350 domain-containing protein [Candidatus Sulfopaludibacter sp.]|jgi:hypothetical protein|nr:DUF4350 domain-containing protein [Candidatus Sulfopaludibacter sp.]
MSNWRSLLHTILLAGSLVAAALYLFGIEFASGTVYPEYSSLRTDPLGVRLLYDSLAAVPGVTVERNYRSLEFLPDHAGTVFLLAIPAEDFGADTEPYLRELEESARRGNRMVAALTLPPTGKLPKFDALQKKWGVSLALDDKTRRHSLYFGDAKGWSGLYRTGSKLLVIERAFGTGSIVLFAGSDDFANDSTVRTDRLRLITLAIGDNSHIIFDEQHLGIADSGSVVALARRFHLMGIALGLALCAALFLWRNGMDFPPPVYARSAGRLAGRTSHAGLLTLLRRHVSPRALAGVCWQEWLAGNRGKLSPAHLQKAEAILNGATDPVRALRDIQAVLHAKGDL